MIRSPRFGREPGRYFTSSFVSCISNHFPILRAVPLCCWSTICSVPRYPVIRSYPSAPGRIVHLPYSRRPYIFVQPQRLNAYGLPFPRANTEVNPLSEGIADSNLHTITPDLPTLVPTPLPFSRMPRGSFSSRRDRHLRQGPSLVHSKVQLKSPLRFRCHLDRHKAKPFWHRHSTKAETFPDIGLSHYGTRRGGFKNDCPILRVDLLATARFGSMASGGAKCETNKKKKEGSPLR